MSEEKKGCCGGHGHSHDHKGGCCGGHGHSHEHKGGCCGGEGHSHEHKGGCCGGEGHSHDNKEGGCKGHSHEEDASEHIHGEEQYLNLLLENDETLKCSVIEIFEVEDKEYIALLPVGDDQILLYRYVEHSEEDFELLNIETDEEFEKVEEAFFDIYEAAMFEEEEYEYDYDDYDDEEEE